MLIDIIKVILPPAITGLLTFFATKYSFHSNMPKDKLAIAYDRVYYPIYRLIKEEDSRAIIIKKCNIYLNKYDKYIDRSTKVAFCYLAENPNSKRAYRNFEDNIYAMNTKLRRQLGYLEPNLLAMLRYMSSSEKRVLRICLEIIICYLSITSIYYFSQEYLYDIFYSIYALTFIFLIIEFIVVISQWFVKLIFRFIKHIFLLHRRIE